MKILYHHRTMADGAEGIHIAEIVKALRVLGHEVQVVALAGDPSQPAPVRATRVKGLRRLIPAAAYELAELGYNLVGYRRMMAAVRSFKPDVIYDRYNSYSTAALRAARRARLPLLLEVNAPVAYERSVYEHLQLKWPRLAQRYEARIFAGADRIFVVSSPLKRHLVETLGVGPEKIAVLPNGADPEVFVPASGEPIRRRHDLAGRFVVGFVGILRPWHGVDLLLEAFAILRADCPSAHLLVVGDGPIQPQLERHARDLGLRTAVTFTGRLPHAEVVAHVAAMDVCVSPQATFYASPMKIVEYMAMGKAVIAPAMDNIRDLIEDGLTGILVEPDRADALAAALLELVNDAPRRRALGEDARRAVLERFNWRRNARCIADSAQALIRTAAATGGRS